MKLTQVAVITALFATTQTVHVQNTEIPVEVNEMLVQEDDPNYEPGLIQIEEMEEEDIDDPEDLEVDDDVLQQIPNLLAEVDANDEATLAEEAITKKNSKK